jgi:hypothetical protein
LLTGMPSGLGVGPGGLLVGPTAAGGGVGLRPRPKSSHTAAVESIARRQAALQVCFCVPGCVGCQEACCMAVSWHVTKLVLHMHTVECTHQHMQRCELCGRWPRSTQAAVHQHLNSSF